VAERLRLGSWVLIREGTRSKGIGRHQRNTPGDIDFRRSALATDGVDPEGFLESGYLDKTLKKALKLGVPPKVAYQMVALSSGRAFSSR
jgi:adenine deaminase